MPVTMVGDTTLSAMITPAIFMTANASLIISTSNRMSRVVDRIRALSELIDKLDGGKLDLDYVPERLAHVFEQFERLEHRGNRIRFALIALYIAFTFFLGTSLSLAINDVMRGRLSALPVFLAVAGVSLLLAAGINLVIEALAALRANRAEARFFRELHRRRQADRAALAAIIELTPEPASSPSPPDPRTGPET